MPPVSEAEIRSMIELLLKTGDPGIMANLIKPVTLLTKVSGETTTVNYIKCILSQDDGFVISSAFRKFEELT